MKAENKNGRIYLEEDQSGPSFANLDELRAAVHAIPAVRQGSGIISNTEGLMISALASRIAVPEPEPSPDELDALAIKIARRRQDRPKLLGNVSSPFDAPIAEARADVAAAQRDLEDATAALEAAKRAAAARSRTKRGPSPDELAFRVEEGRYAVTTADRTWVRAQSRLFALTATRTRWRAENS
jgi:hypothetical protein